MSEDPTQPGHKEPSQAPPTGPYGFGPSQSGSTEVQPSDSRAYPWKRERRFPAWLIAVIVAGLIVIAVSAGIYFLKSGKKVTVVTGPQIAVAKYFDLLPAGDPSTIKELFAPGSQPSDAGMAKLSEAFQIGVTFNYYDPQMRTVSQTPSDASIRVVDMSIQMTRAGLTMRRNLAGYMKSGLVIKLKYVNGQWLLVAQNGALPNICGQGF